jgi:hypothetical protein
LNSPGKSNHYLFELTSLNRHEHTNIRTTGNNKNKTGTVTDSAATNIFRIVPGTVVGITWTLQKRFFLVQLPTFRFPHTATLLNLWLGSRGVWLSCTGIVVLLRSDVGGFLGGL